MISMRLDGCRSDSLLGYLKALGLLRLVALQKDQGVYGRWNVGGFEMLAPFDRSELERYLTQEYRPTPILNPWNNGAGFDGKSDKATETIERLRNTTDARWASYRETIELIMQRFVQNGRRTTLDKDDLVRELRAEYNDEAVSWLDAAIVIGREKSAFPFLLGSGGNDGRLDFSVNFASRALDVVGEAPLQHSLQLLRDALDDTGESALIPGVAIGQFGPRYAGGVNGTSGFDAGSLVNPWDLVLGLEGTVVFSGSVAKRLPGDSERASFPFAFAVTGAGYASASADESTRGELWLPIWSGAASFASVSAMMRSGRADLPSGGEQPQAKTALNASQAAQAALTRGAALGIERFERIAFAQRNGLAYSGTHTGTVRTGDDLAIAFLSRASSGWVERVRNRTESLGEKVRDALHRFDGAVLEYARTGVRGPGGPTARADARHRQDILIELASIEYAAARRGHEELRPLQSIDPCILEALDDGSIEHRAAVALVSLGRGQLKHSLRLDLEHVRFDEKKGLQYDPDARVALSLFTERTLGEICLRRVRAAEARGPNWMLGSAGIQGHDIAMVADEQLDAARLQRLLVAYSLVTGGFLAKGRDEPPSSELPPAAFALIKLVLDPCW
ncbi:MAG: type I-G CRISPR-associated protein Cas8g1/Csx17, partial [Vulcanimicrobiaceae bacterium]